MCVHMHMTVQVIAIALLNKSEPAPAISKHHTLCAVRGGAVFQMSEMPSRTLEACLLTQSLGHTVASYNRGMSILLVLFGLTPYNDNDVDEDERKRAWAAEFMHPVTGLRVKEYPINTMGNSKEKMEPYLSYASVDVLLAEGENFNKYGPRTSPIEMRTKNVHGKPKCAGINQPAVIIEEPKLRSGTMRKVADGGDGAE